MRKFLYLVQVVLSWATLQVAAQVHDLEFSGDFRDVPFQEFVSEVEHQTGATFYYLDKWVAGIKITVAGTGLSLQKILTNTFLPVDIRHYIDEYGHVYLTYEDPVIPLLPDFNGFGHENIPVTQDTASGRMTMAEQRYIEGRSSGLLETLVVGGNQFGGSSTNAVVHGKMVDGETGEPLIGATIYIEELKKGAATDVDGRFSILLLPGKYSVSFNCMGMEPKQNYLQVNSGGDILISMEKGLIPITEVVIEANRFHNVKGNQMGFERLNYKTIQEVPVVLGEKDLLKVALMLPGVQSVGEGSSGFNVRGGAADQNMIYINKVPVYNSSHLFGFFTTFSPDIVKDFSLYKSILPAIYGGRLSSVFDISTRQGNMNGYTARGGISPITAHAAVEGPLARDKSAFVFSARSTYSDWILNQLEDNELQNSAAEFYDLSGTLTVEPNEKSLVKAFGYYSHDGFTLGATNQYEYSNAGASVNVKQRFGSRMTGDMAAVFGQYAFSTLNTEYEAEAYAHGYSINHYEIRSDNTWLSLGRHKITFGINGIYYDLRRGLVEPYGENSLRIPVDLGVERGMELAGYVADEISLSSRLTVYAGLRYSAFLNLGPGEILVYQEGSGRTSGSVTDTLHAQRGQLIKRYSGPEPRISFNYLLGQNNSVKISYNRIQQYLFMLSNTVAISPTDQWKLCDYHITPPSVDQVSLGYYQDIPGAGINTSAELYYKRITDVVEYRDGATFIKSPYTETQVLQGDQQAYGLELMIRKSSGQLSGWLSYSYSRSNMYFNSPLEEERINNGLKYPSNFDRPHSVDMVSTFKVNRRLSISANLVYITGRPVTYPISIYYQYNSEYIDYSERNKYRLPDYFRMDLSVNLEGNLKRRKMAHSFWMLSVYNLTGRKNAYSVYFKNEEGRINGYKLTIFGRPVVTLSWNFKFGNYASE